MPLYYPFFDNTYLVFVLIPVLVSIWASARVNSTFKKYSDYRNARNLTAAEVTRMILDRNGQQNVSRRASGRRLTDHYDPARQYNPACRRAYTTRPPAQRLALRRMRPGHAAQHAKGYVPIKIRNALVPVANLASRLAVPLVLLGFIMELGGLVDFAIILYGAVVLFSLITLPVEFDASRRAVVTLDEYGILSTEENAAAKKVLRAAAMTYVASMLVALGSFLRILTLFGRRRD